METWRKTVSILRKKLTTPQPPEKKVSKYRSYQCPWALGDVFAYQFHGEYSKNQGLIGKYVIFRKVSEDTSYPMHIVPVVKIYAWVGDHIPELSEIDKKGFIPVYFPKWDYYLKKPKDLQYCFKIEAQSKKEIPRDYLTHLGNIQDDDIVPFRGHKFWTGYYNLHWNKYNRQFEPQVIDRLLAWEIIK